MLVWLLAAGLLVGCDRREEDLVPKSRGQKSRGVGTRAELERALGKPSDIGKPGPAEQKTDKKQEDSIVSDSTHHHLTRRLDRLERENRRLKLLGALALLGLAALTVMGQTAATPVVNTIEAERFVLRDGAGHARATLGLRPDGTAALALADDTQQERVVL
ncbi:MAG: hypothetical protein ACREJE_04240, partial [Candidatus Rokuibacteriota bacterium]